MSKEALAKVVQRAISDAAFRRQLNSDPKGALRGFDLSADEASALRTGDAGRLSTLGVDQRMSKSFALGGLASTRMSASDLTPGGGPSTVDDLSGSGGRTVTPADPRTAGAGADASGSEAMRSADVDAGTSGSSTVRAGDDWKFAGRVAPEAGSVRTGDDWKFSGGQETASQARVGDDWKFADRAAAQSGSVAPVEGSPEATALENKSGGATVRAGDDWARAGSASADDTSGSGSRLGKLDDKFSGGNQKVDGMANYPAHDGLAGPSAAASVRAGDDWARAGSASADDTSGSGSRLGKLDETLSGGNQKVDGMASYPAHDGLAGPSSAASVRAGDDWARAGSASLDDSARAGSARLDDTSAGDPGSRLGKLDAMFSGGTQNADASTAGSDAAARLAKLDETFTGGTPAVDASGGSTPTTAFIDESESYLTKVGYDSSASSTPDTTYSGDDIAGPSSVTDAGTDDNPHTSTDDGQLTP